MKRVTQSARPSPEWRAVFSSIACAAIASIAIAACSSTQSSSPSTTNGVNDVRKACDIRATWTHFGSTSCNDCYAAATLPKCACDDKPEAGRCADQQTAFNNEPACNGVDTCVNNCKADCACVDACYAGKDACRTKAAPRDGCAADVCDAKCR